MNYLGHAYLSFSDSQLLTGNMIGDYVKGRIALERFPPRIAAGIELHRKIDAYADSHPAALRAKLLFREHYSLYSGPITDTLFDHFLANDPSIFPAAADLKQFTTATYDLLGLHRNHFPHQFSSHFEHMVEHDWLFNYRSMKGMERSLSGLHRRAKYMPPPQVAFDTFVANYYVLNQCYLELIVDVSSYVKKELNR